MIVHQVQSRLQLKKLCGHSNPDRFQSSFAIPLSQKPLDVKNQFSCSSYYTTRLKLNFAWKDANMYIMFSFFEKTTKMFAIFLMV